MDYRRSAKRKASDTTSSSPPAKQKIKTVATTQTKHKPRFWTPIKSEEYRDTVQIFKSIQDGLLKTHRELKKRGYSTDETENIIKIIQELSVDADSSRPRPSVTFIGIMGSGKTATIDNLIGVRSLVDPMSSSTSGTTVLQHYTRPPPQKDYTELHQSMLVLYPPTKIASLIRDNLSQFYKAYKYCYLDTEEQEDVERTNWQRDLDAALSFFAPLVCHRPECNTTSLLEGWMWENKPKGEEIVFKQLSAWIDEYLATVNLKIRSSDAASLCLRTMQSCRARQDEEDNPLPSPSPLISKVVTEVTGSALLDEGIDLIDRPGTDDKNTLALSQIALSEDCKVRLIVRNYDRALADDKLKDLIREHWDKAEGFGVVITKIDLAGQERDRLSASDQTVLLAWEKEHHDLKQKLQAVKAEYSQKESTDLEYGPLRGQADTLEHKLNAVARKIKGRKIIIGCQKVERGIQMMFHKIIQSNSMDIKIFFLDNSGSVDDSENIAAGLNGITELGDYLARVPSRSKLNHLIHLCLKELPHLLNSLDMLCRRPLIERKAGVEKYVSKPLHSYAEVIKLVFVELGKIVDASITDLTSSVTMWEDAARKLEVEWRKCSAATYGAFCRRGGLWKKRKSDPLLSWNAELLKLGIDHINGLFDTLETRIKAIIPDLEDNLYELLLNIKKDVEQDEKLKGLDLTSFFKYLESGKGVITTLVTDLTSGRKSLFYRVRLIRNRLIREDSKSYLVKYMKDIYEECELIKGTKSFHKRQTVVKRALVGRDGAGGVFKHIVKTAAEDLRLEHGEAQKLAEERLREPFSTALKTFRDSFSAEDVDDDVGLKLREELLPAIETAMRRVEGPLEDMVRCIPEG